MHRGAGLVSEVFSADVLERMAGDAAIGHTLYLRRGGTAASGEDLQPLFVRHRRGELAFCCNGAVTNAEGLREKLEEDGSIFHTRVDIEVVAHLLARHYHRALPDALRVSLASVEGGYAGVWLMPGKLVAARDPHGIRPLCLGKLEWWRGGDPVLEENRRTAWVVASETCTLDTIGAEFVRDVAPGEVLLIDDDGVHPWPAPGEPPARLCSFEYVYFARPDSNLNGRNVHIVRKNLGRELAREHPADRTWSSACPIRPSRPLRATPRRRGCRTRWGSSKTATSAARSSSRRRQAREEGVLVNLNAVRQVVEGQRVVLVDDSVVRGTTSRRLTELLRAAGAKEVHMRISSPPFRHTCPYGIDAADEAELVATGRTEEEIASIVGADSLKFLSLDGLLRAIGGTGPLAAQLQGTFDADGRPWVRVRVGRPAGRTGRLTGESAAGEFCLACFAGWYAVPPADSAAPRREAGAWRPGGEVRARKRRDRGGGLAMERGRFDVPGRRRGH